MREFTKEEIVEIAEWLKEGKVISFATETVYGLAVVYDNKESFDRLNKIKGRPMDKPTSLMLGSVDEINLYAEEDDIVKKVEENFLPGELTLLLKAKKVPSWVDYNTGVVGLRVPNDKFVLSLIKKVGKALLVTSANRSGFPSLTNYDDVKEEFKNDIDGIVEGKCVSNTPSTIINMACNPIKLVREGTLKFNKVKEKIYGNSDRF